MNIKYAAVIVVYHPDRTKLAKLINSIKAQGSGVIVVANDSENYECFNVLSITLQRNMGIAKAQNVGIIRAIERKNDFIALFDQDSVLPESYFTTMTKFFRNFNTKNVGMLVPRAFDLHSHKFIESRCYKRRKGKIKIWFPDKDEQKMLNQAETRKVAQPIASGSFIKVSILEVVGFMNSDYFIDSVDTEFDFRVLENNFDIFQINNLVMQHELGNKVQKKIGKFIIWPSNHSAFRRYYIIRNCIWMWKDHHKKITGATRMLFRTLGSTFIYVQLENGSLKKNIALFRGLLDGIFRKSRS